MASIGSSSSLSGANHFFIASYELSAKHVGIQLIFKQNIGAAGVAKVHHCAEAVSLLDCFPSH